MSWYVLVVEINSKAELPQILNSLIEFIIQHVLNWLARDAYVNRRM